MQDFAAHEVDPQQELEFAAAAAPAMEVLPGLPLPHLLEGSGSCLAPWRTASLLAPWLRASGALANYGV